MEKYNGWEDPKWCQYWGVDDPYDEADIEEPWDED